MSTIEIYHKTYCPFCKRALALFQEKGVKYTEYEITNDMDKRAEMIQRANGAHTVPQIFIDGRHIGGSDDLVALERAGKLDPLLEACKG